MEERLVAVGGQVLFGVLVGDIVRGGEKSEREKKG